MEMSTNPEVKGREGEKGRTTEKKDNGRKIEATTTANGFLWA